MSFLIPRINSKNRKEALRAFKAACKDDAALDAMLRRDDVVIRDEIFAYVKGWRYKLYQSIIGDPTHPYYAEAYRILKEERENKLRDILQMKGDQAKARELKFAVNAFAGQYALTDAERCALGECILPLIRSQRIADTDKRRETVTRELKPFFCLPFAEKHLTDSDIVFPKELALQAADERKLDDRTRKEVYLRHKIADGRLVTKCDIGEHEWEFVKNVFEENHEDWGLSKTRALYRCRICGREVTRDK